MTRTAAASIALLLIAGACARSDNGVARADADTGYQETLMAQLLDAQPGDVIEIPAGVFAFDRSLSLLVDGVTIRGAGMDKTILSFSGQVAGAEGLLVNASDFTIEDLAIEDTKGDGLKVNDGENIIIRRVRTEWTKGPRTENGAYGIYPVQTRNVLIEGNVAIGASDAGIYVGQSRNVVVRGNRAEFNVAGIEIENTFDADVYDNIATNNTGGILVFNMPNLAQPGARTRVFRNEIIANNTRNFGVKGTAVANIPAGSGVVINANDDVHIFDNDIRDHRSANIIVTSVFASGLSQDGMSADFDPYPESIYIHANRMSGSGKNPDGIELQALKLATVGPMAPLPDILWDGFVDPAKMVGGALPDALRLCVQNGAAEVLNFDAPNASKAPRIAERAEHDCALAPLPEIALTGGLAAALADGAAGFAAGAPGGSPGQ